MDLTLCLKKNFRYVNRANVDTREFIKPSTDIGKDISIRKTAHSVEAVRGFVTDSLRTLGFASLNVEDQLASTSEMMFRRFKINRLKCRMDLVYSDKCRQFHIDRVYMRCITTLLGPGTELLFANDPSNIYQVKTGDALLVKGSLNPQNDFNVLHKSPSISHLGISRLVFVMDY